MCQKLIKFPKLFKEHFISNFISLGSDPVINVRLSVAIVLAKMVVKKNEIAELGDI